MGLFDNIAGDFKIKNGVLVKYRGKDSNVVIPSNVTTIGDGAFYKCESITSITIPNSVTSIGNRAFDGCTSLTSITIPNSVTSLGEKAFLYCTSLTSLTITNSVTSIGKGICARCTQLKQINVDEGNPNYTSIDGNLYTKDKKTLVQYAIGKKDTSFTIPSSVTSIDNVAFYDCPSLTSITIPNSVTSIGEYAFYGCKNLKTVYNLSKLKVKKGADTHGCVAKYADNVYTELPKTQSSSTATTPTTTQTKTTSTTSTTQKVDEPVNLDFDIQNGVLVKYKGRRKNVIIPNNVTEIGDRAFQSRITPASITIPNSVTSIGVCAFDDCTSLTSITIPNSVTRIGDRAFYGCTSLKSITIPNSVTSIGWCAFKVCASLTSVTIGDSVESIEGYAFEDCTSLASVIIGNSVKSIGEGAFWGCKSLTSITIPDSVTSIGSSAFNGCTSLKSITIPNSVTSIDDSAFSGCKSLKTVYNLSKLKVKKGAKTHGYVAYYADNVYTELPKTQSSSTATTSTTTQTKTTSTTSTTQKVAEPVNPDFEIKDGVLVKYKGKGGNVVIPRSVKTIDDEAFYECKSLTSITIPSSVESIGNAICGSCSSLKQIVVNENNAKFQSIDGSLYTKSGNTLVQYAIGSNVKAFTIPSSVTSIGVFAFDGCTSLQSITIPNSVTSIGDSAFDGCTSLQSITIPNSVASIGVGICASCTKLKQINVEAGNADYITIDGNLYTRDGKTLVQYAIGKKDTSFTIPNSVTSIEIFAFYDCTSLQSITIPSSVTSIGDWAFSGCESLKTVYNLSKLDIQKGAVTHGCVAYYADNVYTELPKSIEQSKLSKIDKVDTQASDMLGNIPKDLVDKNKTKIVSTPDFVVNADGVLIEYKGSAENIVIPNTVIGIGANVFENTAITSLKCGDNLYFIDGFAFNDCSSLKTIELGNGLRYVGDYAFALCTSLKTITLPVSLVRIGTGAFEGCDSIKKVYNQSALDIEKKSKGHGNVAENATIVYEQKKYLESFTITDGTVVAYEGGKDYRVIALPSTVKSIGSEAFANNDTLEEIHTPDSLVEIGYRAFENCSKLRKVVLGSELERIAMHAFTKCASLDAIELPDTLTTIASWSFDDCTSLKEIVIPASVTAIEDGTFYGCTSLEKVTFLGKIQSIGAYAFDGCVALKEINLPKNCNVDETAFNNTTCKVYNK